MFHVKHCICDCNLPVYLVIYLRATNILLNGQGRKTAAKIITVCVHIFFGVSMEEKIYRILEKDLKRALKHNEVPVAALIMHNDKVLAHSYNKKNKSNNVLDHAEIICINKASKKIKTWHLDDCKMFVTLQPCSICDAVIKNSHIKEVKYFLEKETNKKEYYKTRYKKENNDMSDISKKYIEKFFANKR